MELAYGPNGGQSNLSVFTNGEYAQHPRPSLRVRSGRQAAKLYHALAENVAGSGARFTITVPGATRAVAAVEDDLPVGPE